MEWGERRQLRVLSGSLHIPEAELSRYKLLVQSCAGGLVDIQKTIASCHLKINQEGQPAGTAHVQAPEIISKAGGRSLMW